MRDSPLNRAGRRSGGPRGAAASPSSNGRLVSVAAAAAYMGISVSSLRDLIAGGHVRRVVLGDSRRVFVRRDDLDSLIERSTERAS